MTAKQPKGEKANFKVDPRLTKLLGESYRSTEHALKELVDNAWDADATTISVELPDAMTGVPIVIFDNGCGMTEHEVRNEYLAVANDRYSRKGERTTRLKRLVKGRKGIGKFAGLMVANVMEIETTAHGKTTRIVISKSDLLAAPRDLERIDLPITVESAASGASGTKVTLFDLNQHYAFPLPEKLKNLLMLEYGREESIEIAVNGSGLSLDDLPGEHFEKEESVPDAGTIRLSFKVSDGSKPLKQSGIAIRVGGKIVGKLNFFGLEDDPEIPQKLLKKIYGEVEADELADSSVTADWGDIVENSKVFQSIKPVIQSHIKVALEGIFKREVNLQRARIQRQINLRLAEMPEHRRRFAQVALEKVMRRFYGESDEKVETIASVVLDAFDKDEYWQVLQRIDESKDRDVGEFASALEDFGLLDMAVIANQAQSRLKLLDHLDALIRNPATLEKIVHGVIERNLWILGPEYALIASNRTLAKTIEEYTEQKFTGKRAEKRPDLFLAQSLSGTFLLIEFKRPSKDISRADQNQAAEYRDDLEPKFGQIEIVLIGRARDSSALIQNDAPRLKVFGYEALVSTARTQLDWLLKGAA
ncbi:MAG: ATP-binding protein [Sulfuritalea sp.]|nr:ATP-binding protein [Sulfuritalea sp.]MDP1982967.1 ATP-binding protein [Sulfuritalea sp.]